MESQRLRENPGPCSGQHLNRVLPACPRQHAPAHIAALGEASWAPPSVGLYVEAVEYSALYPRLTVLTNPLDFSTALFQNLLEQETSASDPYNAGPTVVVAVAALFTFWCF